MISKNIAALLILLALFLCPVLTQASSQNQASPHKAVLFPDSARIWQQIRLPLLSSGQDAHVQFYLPAQARPETLNISLDQAEQLAIQDVQWAKAEPRETKRIQELQTELQGLKNDQQAGKAESKALAARISFWEEQAAFQDKDLQELDQLSASIFRNLQQGYSRQASLEQDIQDLQKKIQEMEKRLQEMTGTEQASWEVTVSLDGSGTAQKILVRYDFILTDCGWEPIYRIEAKPKQEELLFDWQARAWQSSGQDWQNTQLSLATMQTPRSLDPPKIPDWIVRPIKEVVRPMAREDKMLALEAATPRTAPELERKGTYSIWHLGQRDLQAGERPRLQIQEETWPAEFVRLLRPSRGQEAFLQADLQLEQARDIPRGEATFFWDGALLGKRDFTFQGREKIMHLGPDPFVTAELITRDKRSGARGWLRGKQTYYWDFMIEVTNSHDYPVQIRLEEPRPRIRDEHIQAEFSFRPEPSEQTESLFIWELELQAEQSQEIGIEIEMQAPEDMDIDWGWRQ